MANICSYSACVTGTKEGISKFIDAMRCEGDYRIGRGADVYKPHFNEDETRCTFCGSCKWSLESSLVVKARSMRDEPDSWYGGRELLSQWKILTIDEACREFSVCFEAYGEEYGLCFQEHILIDSAGEVILDQCEHAYEYCIGDYNTKEEAEKELGIEITDQEYADEDYVVRGGFGEWKFSI